MVLTRSRPVVAVLALLAHVVITRLVWRDIDRRPARQLRGSKKLWRTLTAANLGNSLVYAVVGVRRGA